MTLPRIDQDGNSCLQRPELEQARNLGYKVAMTEWNWNGWWGGEAKPSAALDSLFARGVGAAGILHAIMRQGDVVEAANQSMLIGDGWGIHAICCDRDGKRPPFMIPSGQATMLYSHYHGDRRLRIDVSNMPRYDQPYRMAGIGPSHAAAYLDLLATRDDHTLYLHAINRHFSEALTAALDFKRLNQQSAGTAVLRVLTGRLKNEPASSDPAPGQIEAIPIDVAKGSVRVTFPRRSVAVVEVSLRGNGHAGQ